jgi:pimeloyl-ACP methyl ester carboxylesterase
VDSGSTTSFSRALGGILAMEYALKYQQHLRGLVISNMAAGIRAQEIEVKYPHLVKALVLVDTTAHGTGKDATADAFLAVVDKRGAEKAIQNLSDLSFGSSAPPALLEWARREAIQSPEFVARAAIRSISDADTRNSLSQIEAPTLVICGDEDPVTPPHESESSLLRFLLVEAAQAGVRWDPDWRRFRIRAFEVGCWGSLPG